MQNEKITSKILGVIGNFLRKFSPNLSADSINKTLKTNHPFILKGMEETNSLSAPSTIDSTRSRRLGFMEGEGRVPDDFNTIGSSEIESMFYDNK